MCVHVKACACKKMRVCVCKETYVCNCVCVCNSVRVIASASFYFQHFVIFIRRVLCNNDRSDCFPSVRKCLFHAYNTSYAYSTSSANICLDANNRVSCSSTISGRPSSSFSLKSFGFPHLPGSRTWATPWR